jgi:Flp pilus assembly protein TadD
LLGADHPRTLGYEADLYDTLVQQNRSAEAEPLLRFLVSRMELTQGATHTETIRVRNDLARCCRALGNFTEAESLIDACLAALPAESDLELSLAVRGNLAALRLDQHDYTTAEPLLRDALSMSQSVRGPEHPRTLILEHKHALALEHLGRTREAADIWSDLAPRLQRTFGPDNKQTREAQQHLAKLSKS